MAFFKPAFQTTFANNSKCYVGNKIPGRDIKHSFGLVYQVTNLFIQVVV